MTTTTYITFLRGINVGAHNRMAMADLRALCTSLGLEDVQTYIQSGNVVFESPETDARHLSAQLEKAIADEFGYDVSVMVRTRAELDDVVARQPFDEPTDDHTNRYVTFLSEPPVDEQVQALLSAANTAEEFVMDGREVYSRIDSDQLQSGRFTDAGDKLRMAATRRNWTVVTVVQAMTD